MTSPHETITAFPPGDYVSSGYARIWADPFFPNMVAGERDRSDWPHLRREIPHNWYVDRRQPTVGFVSRDEAHILYNTARRYPGIPALEIGCWLGWSACHLALGGVTLDVIDPLLGLPDIYASVSGSLSQAGISDRVTLVPGVSPARVLELAGLHRRGWNLFFIDGNHEPPGPLDDAKAVAACAPADALVLFHDLASPAVAEGLALLRARGWKTMLYQTMQIMGVAWRGSAQPVAHVPDPAVPWTIPDHLRSWPVCGS
ncbi:MAG: class I SAM-dependent methyltransferase [Pseudomonadota bacterium]|nr:class I SAM-dependent methyltransferase [Pseudomonadota bacterium]